jgi:aryl sulfotransferase
VSGIFWLASYPKSGNTWFRIFLTNLQRNTGTPADINALNTTPIASARELFDDAVGYEAGDLTPEEVDRLRSRVYESLAASTDETLFLKIHDAYSMTDADEPLVPTRATQGALYFIRNPLDVCVSFAHYGACEVEAALRAMSDDAYALGAQRDRLPPQLRQRLLSWRQHVLSWVERPPFPVLVIRYEDMHCRPMETFTRATAFAGLPQDPERIGRALRQSAFAEVQRQEQAHGFRERVPRAASFFRQGSVGSWRQQLTPEQAERLVDAHRDVMRCFGYLTDDDKPVF